MSVAKSRRLAEFADRYALAGLLRLHVVAEQDIHVAEIKFAASNDRVGPRFLVAAVRLLEAAMFLEAVGRSFNQDHRALVLRAQVEPAIGIEDRAFARRGALPFGLAGLEILAGPALVIRMAIDKIVHLDDAAVLIAQHLVGIDLLGGELAAGVADLEQGAADAVGGGDIDAVVAANRRGDDRRLALARRPPEQLAVRRRDARHAVGGQLDVLPHAVNLRQHERRVMRGVSELPAAPNYGASLLVERDNRPIGPAGSDYHLVTVDQGRFSKTPVRKLAAEVFDIVLAPEFLAPSRIEANQLAPLADRDQQAALHRRRAAGSFEGGHPRRTGFAELGRPDLLAVGGVQRDDRTGLGVLANGVDSFADDGHSGVADAQDRKSTRLNSSH